MVQCSISLKLLIRIRNTFRQRDQAPAELEVEVLEVGQLLKAFGE